jgi:NAD(P)-dependent dehydrogenase (short-subunit alcohol dehydrogenase family)
MGQYDGKRAVITGATSGIGLATAKLLIAQGGRVLATGRAKGALESARKELGKQAIVIESDAASLADIDRLHERAKSELETLDLLFVNAGVTRFVPFESMTAAMYDELLAVNARSSPRLSPRAAPSFSLPRLRM